MVVTDRIAAGFRSFAEREAPGRSPLYGELARDVSTDADVLAFLAAMPEAKWQPQLLFSAVDLVCYLSQILTLAPGDLIATGTPGGVGHARTPPRYLTDGAVLVTAVAGIGELRNTCRLER